MREVSDQAKADIQGIIASGFGHLLYASYFFIHIGDGSAARSWLGTMLPRITTGSDWAKDAEGNKIKPDHTWNIGLTHTGLAKLGLNEKTLATFSLEFIEGMSTKRRSRILGDLEASSPEHWEIGGAAYRDDNALHILVVMYALDDPVREAQRQWLLDSLAASEGGIRLVHEDLGRRPEAEKEHFGFRDGVSNPKVQGFGSNTTEPSHVVVKTGEFVLGYLNEYDQYPPTPLVWDAQDQILPRFDHGAIPGEVRDLGRNGSYLVYRKLNQNVAAFWNFVQAQSMTDDAKPDKHRMLWMASKFVGRWPSGAALVLAPDHDDEALSFDNDFVFMQEDPYGARCPFSSHVRRSNPRDSFLGDSAESSFSNSNQHRLMRRGTAYGKPMVTPDMISGGAVPVDLVDDGEERGIHFICINADIRRQFEFVQQGWCNNPKFNGLYDDKDPIIGDHNGSYHVTIEGNPIRERVMNLPRFVEVRGGEYFFVPSLNAIRYLAQL